MTEYARTRESHAHAKTLSMLAGKIKKQGLQQDHATQLPAYRT